MRNIYEVKAKLYLIDGTIIDISQYIRGIHISQSIKSRYILCDLTCSNTILTFINQDFSHISLQISYRAYENSDLYLFTFQLVPSRVNLNSFIEKENEGVPYHDYVKLKLCDLFTYGVSQEQVKSKIWFDTNIKTVLNDIVQAETDPTMQTDYIEQVYIPTMTLDSALNYLQYWFGFYVTASEIAYVYDPETFEVKIKVIDIAYRLKTRLVDTVIKKIAYDSTPEPYTQELEIDNLVVTHNPIEIRNSLSETLQWKNLVFIEKPLDYLYRKFVWANDSFVNAFGAVDTSIDLVEDNVVMKSNSNIVVRNHTGFSVYPITSLLGQNFSHGVKVYTVQDLDKPFKLWPSYIVELRLPPDVSKFSGVYHCDTVIYDLSLTDANWKMVSTAILERGNYITR